VDWRYVALKQKLGVFWLPVNLLGIHLFPTVLVYLGELGFWFGLFAFALAASSDAWWTGTGIAAMALLFAGISIPMQERKLAADKPEYALWRKRSFALLPLSHFREKLR